MPTLTGIPSTDLRPSFVSLFTGAGGLDIGLESAGFSAVAAVECDDDCVATLRANRAAGVAFGPGRWHLEGAVIVPKRVEDVDPDELKPLSAPRDWVPDLVAGGPPCQPFSSSGSMGSLADPRGRLFEHFVRLAASLRPRLILFENVRGLVTARGPRGEPGEALSLVKESFERIGYATRLGLLNAADFGCPQRRVRLFLLAARDAELPPFPTPTHAAELDGGLFERRRPWVTLGEFLASRPAPDPEDVVEPTPRLAAQLAALSDGTGLRSAGAREATRPGGHWGYRQGTFIADPSLPARTVTASASQDWVRVAGTLRRLTWRECAALQGFPEGWHFAGGKASRFRQIGNAVPVVLGRALGEALHHALLTPRGEKRVMSAGLPAEFLAAIDYTKKEQRRNGSARARVIRLQQSGKTDQSRLKGFGSAESRGA